MSNQQFVSEYCANLLKSAFPHLQPCVCSSECEAASLLLIESFFILARYRAQITSFVSGLREQNGDPVRFKVGLRDFLVQLREVQGSEDTADLFADEKEAAMQVKQEEERARAVQVPGLVKVSAAVHIKGHLVLINLPDSLPR